MRVLDANVARLLDVEVEKWKSYTLPNECNALHVASHVGNFSMIDFLIEIGMSTTAASNLWGTALHVALQNRNETLTYRLLQHDSDSDSVNEDRRTALHLAVLCGFTKIVSIMLHQGWNPIAQDKGMILSCYRSIQESLTLNRWQYSVTSCGWCWELRNHR
jgi:ankyrin repeat protein